MKPDHEQFFANSVLYREDDAKASQYFENNWDRTELKSRDTKDILEVERTTCDLRCDEEAEDRLKGAADAFGRDIRKLDSPEDDGRGNEDSSTSDSHSSARGDSFRKDSVVYMDKSVTECDLATERVVKDICMDEGVQTHDKYLFANSVDEKGVCMVKNGEHDREKSNIHETVRDVLKEESLKKSSGGYVSDQLDVLDSIKNDNNGMSTIENADEEKPSAGKNPDDGSAVQSDTRAVRDTEELANDVAEVILVSQCDKHTADPQPLMLSGEVENNAPTNMIPTPGSAEYDSKDLMLREKAKNDASPNETLDNISTEAVTLGDMLLMEKPDYKPRNFSCHEPEKGSSQSQDSNRSFQAAAMISRVDASNRIRQELVQPDPESATAAIKSEEGEEEKVFSSLSPTPAAEVNENSDKCENSENTSLTSTLQEPTNAHTASEALQDGKLDGAVTTVDGNPTFLASNDSSEIPRYSVSESHDLRNSYVPEDPNEQISSHIRDSLGETSFSAAGPVSGLITYSGPIAYSGSLSLRSDSSTTSTRSFAFPVLQSEWNSSPVRMAKADRRHLPGRKRWKQSLLCCRF